MDNSPSTAVTERLVHVLRSRRENVYALLDAARSPQILSLLRQTEAKYASLYSGNAAEELADYAPYLAEVKNNEPLLLRLVTDGWNDAWGYYLVSNASFDALRTHLRKFLMVNLEDGPQVYFRFYDPRVARVFLSSCTREEAGHFLQNTLGVLCPGDEPNSMMAFRMVNGQIQSTVLSLPAEAEKA